MSKRRIGGRVDWGEVEQYVSKYTVLPDNTREVAWFELAWEHLETDGCTIAADALQRCRAIVCFITLGQTYREFAEWLVENPVSRDITEFNIFQNLGIPALHAAAILNPEDADDMYFECIDSDEQFIDEAVGFLIEDHLRSVGTALLHGFGSKEAICASMYETVTGSKPPEYGSDAAAGGAYADMRTAYEGVMTSKWLFEK